MRTAREILRLALSQRQRYSDIARSCRVDPKTVAKYIQRFTASNLNHEQLGTLSDSALELILKNKKGPKQSVSESLPFSYIRQELMKKGVTRQLLWEEYIAESPDGYKRSQFFHYYRKWEKTLNPSMRQTHKAGEKLFVDYSGQTAVVTDRKTGEERTTQIFVAVLGASKYTYAEATYSQNLSDWINSHVNAFRFLGGVPELIVPDNLKSGVTKANRYEPDVNREYWEMANHYETAIMPARVRRPQDKSHAENGVLLAQRWILAVIRNRIFFSLAELNREILKLLTQLNRRRFMKLDSSRDLLFELIDKPALRPLPQTPYTFANWAISRVENDYHVALMNHFYSVPYQLIKEKVELRYTARTVEIFHNHKRVASHLRDDTKNGSSTEKSHMPESHLKYMEWTPTKLLTRAKEIGDATYQLVSGIMERKKHPTIGVRSTLGIIRLARHYDEERLNAACLKAITIQSYSYQSIKSILEKGLDRTELPATEKLPVISHENLRGESYYLDNSPVKPGDPQC